MNRIRVNTIGMNAVRLGIQMNTSTDIVSNVSYRWEYCNFIDSEGNRFIDADGNPFMVKDYKVKID